MGMEAVIAPKTPMAISLGSEAPFLFATIKALAVKARAKADIIQ